MKAPPLPEIGDVIASHTIVRKVGEGGMGVVYLARNRIGREVALKVLRPEKSGNPVLVQDFVNEGEATGQVDHENVVTVVGQGEENGRHFILMEFVDGPPLDEYLEEQGRLPWQEAVEIAMQVAQGLAHAHGKGLVHRDVKPENVLLYRDGRARLIDFGIVKDISSVKGYLLKGRKVGTAAYASPEQALGKRLDASTDMYSLGASLYRMVCGHPPFTGRSRKEILAQHVRVEPTPPSKLVPDIPKPLCNAILKMLAKRQPERYESMERLLVDLRLILGGKVAIADKGPRADPSALRGIRTTRAPLEDARKRSRVQPEAVIVVALLLVVLGIVLMMFLK